MPAVTATAVPQVAPMSAATGVPAVDQLIRILQARDTAAWNALVRLSTYSCTTDSQFTDRPLCLAGEADGTPVEALPESIGTGECRIAVPSPISEPPRSRPCWIRRTRRRARPGRLPLGDQRGRLRRPLRSRSAGPWLRGRRPVVHLESGRVTSLADHCTPDFATLDSRMPAGDVLVRPSG